MIMYISLTVIAVVFLGSIWYTKKAKRENKLVLQRRTIESLPSVLSTLGVLGTFIGITAGLVKFDTGDLDSSIPLLLSGLQTAFFTSLAGMLGSLLLRHFVTNIDYDAQDAGISSSQQAAITICQEIQKMSNALQQDAQLRQQDSQAMLTALQSMMSQQTAFYNSVSTQLANVPQMSQSITNVENAANQMLVFARSQDASLSEIKDSQNQLIGHATNQYDLLEAIRDTANANAPLIKEIAEAAPEINRNVGELLDIANGDSTTIQEILDETKLFSEVLRGEIDDIEIKMADQNKFLADKITGISDVLHNEIAGLKNQMDARNLLLTQKFDEFSELLKKSNTEALVEVMKKVTEEFQKSMNELIGKLIQENFDQLNKSVEQLNQWQQENKAMIESLTKQYKEMETAFESTSTTVKQVSSDVLQLAGNGGKLSQLIGQLQKVMIDDDKFVQIAGKLESTATLAKTNMESFDKSTTEMQEWINKQRNFADSVKSLIAKLDELNRFRDFNDGFWRDTKAKMNESVGIIENGSRVLQAQLTNLDKKFYDRLTTTLSELDACIQAMTDANNNHSRR